MQSNTKRPSIEEVKKFLESYGWRYRETTSDDNKMVIISPYTLEKEKKGILISFRVEGEFVMVSTVGFLKNIPDKFSKVFLSFNDRIKLVKLFIVTSSKNEVSDIELGFELWGESWNENTFCSFMDMLCLGIEKVSEDVLNQQIPHQTDFVTYG